MTTRRAAKASNPTVTGWEKSEKKVRKLVDASQHALAQQHHKTVPGRLLAGSKVRGR